MKRFTIRTLLVVVGIAAVLTWAALLVRDRHTSVPLANAIATANARLVGLDLQLPPLTESDVVSAIESQMPKIPDPAKGTYQRIVDTRRLPLSATLDSPFTFSDKPGKWAINLKIMYDTKKGYGLRVYEHVSPMSPDEP